MVIGAAGWMNPAVNLSILNRFETLSNHLERHFQKLSSVLLNFTLQRAENVLNFLRTVEIRKTPNKDFWKKERNRF